MKTRSLQSLSRDLPSGTTILLLMFRPDLRSSVLRPDYRMIAPTSSNSVPLVPLVRTRGVQESNLSRQLCKGDGYSKHARAEASVSEVLEFVSTHHD